MVTCCVPTCDNSDEESDAYSFFVFPNNRTDCQTWTKIIRRKLNIINWVPPKDANICEQHFEDECFVRTLAPGSIPTIFESKCEETPVTKKRKIEDTHAVNTVDDIKLEIVDNIVDLDVKAEVPTVEKRTLDNEGAIESLNIMIHHPSDPPQFKTKVIDLRGYQSMDENVSRDKTRIEQNSPIVIEELLSGTHSGNDKNGYCGPQKIWIEVNGEFVEEQGVISSLVENESSNLDNNDVQMLDGDSLTTSDGRLRSKNLLPMNNSIPEPHEPHELRDDDDNQKQSKNLDPDFEYCSEDESDDEDVTAESNVKDTSLKFSNRSKRIWDKKDFCPFCNEEVTNFSRHLLRKHKDEQEVQNIMKLPKKDPGRKQLFDGLRKTGNFNLMTEKKICCPVQRPPNFKYTQATAGEYLPCQYCLGLYKKNSLNRHVRVCSRRPSDRREERRKSNPLSESQTLLVMHNAEHASYMANSRLKNEVFPIMAADEVSKTAKSDPLICLHGEAYLRRYKKIRIKNRVSNDLREFGRLLLCVKKSVNISSMMDMLNPNFFESVIEGIKVISGYDVKTESFKAPSLVLRLRSSLDNLCATAEKLILEKHPLFPFEDPDAKLRKIKDLRILVRNHYTEEISSLALKALNEKKLDKLGRSTKDE